MEFSDMFIIHYKKARICEKIYILGTLGFLILFTVLYCRKYSIQMILWNDKPTRIEPKSNILKHDSGAPIQTNTLPLYP